MKYFTIKELSKSNTALRLGIDNTPNKDIEDNLNKLVDNVLDPLREVYGKPIIVSSGYRCPKLNTVIGGEPSSQHKFGLAADITTVSDTYKDNKILFDLILKLDLPFDLLIYEFGNNNGPDWIHVSYGSRNRKQILRAKKSGGRTVYNKY